jgi:hypothetical protein
MSSCPTVLASPPSFWALLTAEDQRDYLILHAQFHEELANSHRGESLDIFVQRVQAIHAFVHKDRVSQWQRSVVCGVIFLKSAMAINIHQLRTLLGRCKSSINGSFQQLGYITKPATLEIGQEIKAAVPILDDQPGERKKWTVRYGSFPGELEAGCNVASERAESPIITTGNTAKIVQFEFPCPAKCRHKFYDIFYTSTSIQTEM